MIRILKTHTLTTDRHDEDGNYKLRDYVQFEEGYEDKSSGEESEDEGWSDFDEDEFGEEDSDSRSPSPTRKSRKVLASALLQNAADSIGGSG